MATVTLAALRSAVRDRGEVSTVYIGNGELDGYIRSGVNALWDHVSSRNPFWHTSYNDSISISSGDERLAFSTIGTDVYRVTGVDVKDENVWVPLRRSVEDAEDYFNDYAWDGNNTEKRQQRYRIEGREIVFVPAVDWSGTLRVRYIPVAPVLTDPGDTAEFDNEWSEYVIWYATELCLIKEESDPSNARRMKLETLGRIISANMRDLTEPARVRRREIEADEWW
jgi:hypothetical protein